MILNLSTLLGLIQFNQAGIVVTVEGTDLAVTDDLPPQDEPQKIPKMFHTIWIDFGRGEKVFPKYEKNIKKIMEMHPGWEHKNWNEKEIIQLISMNHPYFLNTFKSYEEPIKKQDAARYVILDAFGGVYIDHDFIALKNIEPLMKSYDVICASEDPSNFSPVGGFFGSIPKHPLLEKMIREMNRPEIAKKFVLEATGPGFVKRSLIKYTKEHGSKGIKVYSNKFFYPVAWHSKKELKGTSRSKIKKRYPESYLVQEYDACWQE